MEIDWLADERWAWESGYRCIAGIDEAGRGALAGPVVAACVVLPFGFVPPGVNDSKQLSAAQREACFALIVSSAIVIGVGCIPASVIDKINILKATHEAMRAALRSLPGSISPDIALIDGLPVRPFPIPHKSIVGGDAKCASIAAASVVAKITRDRLMQELDLLHPAYRFSAHKGYGTKAHIQAIREHGPCTEHRLSFKPIASAGGEMLDRTGQHILNFSERE